VRGQTARDSRHEERLEFRFLQPEKQDSLCLCVFVS
jgi:hypothetical protein